MERPYDCLVPLSGGKDSTYALYLATRHYGMKTLAVTLDNGYLSNPAKENIRNALAATNADHIYYTMNRKNATELFKIFIEKTGNFCNACMRGINYSIEFSTRAFKIPLVIKGSGRRVQYVSQIKEVTSLNTGGTFSRVIQNSEAKDKYSHLAGRAKTLEFQKIAGGVCDILGLPRSALMRFIPQHIGLYDYIYKPYPEIIAILKSELKWSDAAGSAEHLDCELHDVPFFRDTLRVPNITPHTFYYSGLIRQGLMTREEALKREEDELGKVTPPAELIKFLSENEISYDEYEDYVSKYDKSKFESRLQRKFRDIYHALRRF